MEEPAAAQGNQCTPVLYSTLRNRVELKNMFTSASLALCRNNLGRWDGQRFCLHCADKKFLHAKCSSLKKSPYSPCSHYPKSLICPLIDCSIHKHLINLNRFILTNSWEVQNYTNHDYVIFADSFYVPHSPSHTPKPGRARGRTSLEKWLHPLTNPSVLSKKNLFFPLISPAALQLWVLSEIPDNGIYPHLIKHLGV